MGQGREARKHKVNLENSQSFMQREGEERGSYTALQGPVLQCWPRAYPEDNRELPGTGKLLVTVVFSGVHIGQPQYPFELH